MGKTNQPFERSAVKNPFPGMNPYLEALCGDVHTSLIIYTRDQLQRQMPPGLLVRADEQVTTQIAPEGNGSGQSRRKFYPDVRVVEHRPRQGTTDEAASSGVALAE
jgi:hypothetical protein